MGPPVDSPSITMGSARKSGIQPIAALNPYNMSWTIKARLVKKGLKRSFTKGASSTSVFSAELVDNQVQQHCCTPKLSYKCEKMYVKYIAVQCTDLVCILLVLTLSPASVLSLETIKYSSIAILQS